jgi:RNA polymerase sigma factor (sigma-70 family)
MSRRVPSIETTRITAALEDASRDLLAFLARRAGDDDAADLLADVALTAWRRPASMPEQSEGARMWLFGIARNTLANAQRSERRRWSLADRVRTEMTTATPTASPDTDQALEIRAALDTLEPDDAELIRLIHWDGFSVRESAELLGLNESTARSRHARAKDALRQALQPEQRK